jgi:hypothetical protein
MAVSQTAVTFLFKSMIALTILREAITYSLPKFRISSALNSLRCLPFNHIARHAMKLGMFAN